MRIDVQLSQAVESWPSLRTGVRLAEERGFDTAWVFDHFDGSMLGGTSMLECFATLAALAVSTERIRLGSLVVNVANRPAAVMAQTAATVQELAGGRFVLGLGAGAAPGSRWSTEHEAMGIGLAPEVEERHRRLDAALDVIDRFWLPQRAVELATFALPRPRPRIVLGVNSVPLARIAGARCDGINVRASHRRLAAILDAAQTARQLAGRGDRSWDCSVWAMWDEALLDPDHRDRRRWNQLGVNRLVLVWLGPHDPARLAAATPRP